MDSIKVVVRVRPMVENQGGPEPGSDRKVVPPNRNLVEVVDDNLLHLAPRSKEKLNNHTFSYDRVFSGESTQQHVFANTAEPLIESLMEGYNATVFAYGATGCGKTFTVTGTPQTPGLIPQSVARLFELIEKSHHHKSVRISLSYLEIYNEKIRDLLVPGETLSLREIGTGIEVTNLSQHEPTTVEQVTELIIRGNARRTQSPTAANAESSRSHAVLQIKLLQTDTNSGIQEEQCMSTLSIIDLAGSERASTTKNKGQQLKEGAAINRSLLALGRCINALSTSSQFIPYRESNLTRLLKFSLGGNCRTLMIACVSPNAIHYDDTLNTLNYANQAKQIKTRSSKSTTTVHTRVTDYQTKIKAQSTTIAELQERLERGDQVLEAYIVKVHSGAPLSRVLADFRREKTWSQAQERILGLVAASASASASSSAHDIHESPSKRPCGIDRVPFTPVRNAVSVPVPGSAKRFLAPSNGDTSFDTSID